ncbi:unnamed protein product [Rhizoctonia solani]|uniref:Extracellular mutant protein 11 C-terminal domain-containing protein n=1 Tax=Rhizoctonia solani TaxID=456999 RepID=A0A8H3DC95_9AGAM|nr:unnamed protein product [Rhizoctonia solani]
MNNPRRFTPGMSRPNAPSTPRSANKVLPTPPTSATPAFRVPEDNAADRNSESVNMASRPQTSPITSAQPGVRPKLPIEAFAKNKRPQPGVGSRGMNSPARPSRVLVQSVVDAEHPPRPQRIFGQSNGLLPSLSSPPPPALFARTAQQNVPARFSSPFSPPEDQVSAGNPDVEQDDELDVSGPHTSAPGQPDNTTVYQRAFQAHSSVRQVSARRQNTPVPDIQDEFEDPGMESPSPVKRRAAGDHGHQAPTKRMRSTLNHAQGQNLDEDRCPSQELLSTAPQPSQTNLPHGYYSTSLEAYIEAHQSEWVAAQKRWETCTMEEWQNGPKELTAELEKVMDMVKTFMAKRMEVYAGINKDVQTHKTRLDGRDAQLAKEKGRLIKQAGGLAGGFIPS